MLWVIVCVSLCALPFFGRSSPALQASTSGTGKLFVENSALHPRPLVNAHTLSGVIYLLGAVYAFLEEQFDLAVIFFFTWATSTAYHVAREARYFNLDFVFAMSIAMIYLWTMRLSAPSEYWDLLIEPLQQTQHCKPDDFTFLLGLAGFPLAVFLFVLCGAPSELVVASDNGEQVSSSSSSSSSSSTSSSSKESACLYCRRDRPLYNIVHPLWHLLSGCCPFLMVRYFTYFCSQSPGVTLGAQDLFLPIPGFIGGLVRFPTVCIAAICTSVALNVFGNLVGLMPVM